MPLDLPEWRAYYFRRYGTSPTSFAKRLFDHKGRDFYFTLDEVRTSCQRDRYLDLVYLLIQLDEQYIGHRALVSAGLILDAKEIPALYACEVSLPTASRSAMTSAKSHSN